MQTERTTVKSNLANYYDEAACEYADRMYVKRALYSPMQYRQNYIENMIGSSTVSTGAKILDVGCGPGRLVLALLEKGYQTWGVDISRRMVTEAGELVRNSGFSDLNQLFVGDIDSLPFDNAFFDIVVASGVLEYQRSDHAALAEMNRVLVEGGLLVINVTVRHSYRKLFLGAYSAAMRNPLLHGFLRKVKNSVPSREDLAMLPPRRTHWPSQFNRTLKRYGFRKLSHNYFDFSPIPGPFDALARNWCRRIGRRMEGLTTSRLGPLGGGYLVLAQKLAGT